MKNLENYDVSDIKVIAVRNKNSELNNNPILLDVTIYNILKGLERVYSEKYNIEACGIYYKNLIDLFIKIGNIFNDNKM